MGILPPESELHIRGVGGGGGGELEGDTITARMVRHGQVDSPAGWAPPCRYKSVKTVILLILSFDGLQSASKRSFQASQRGKNA